MTEREKIVEILNKNYMQKEVIPVFVTEDGQETELPKEVCEIFNNIILQAVIPYFADTLIANGIGDISKMRYTQRESTYYESAIKRLQELENAIEDGKIGNIAEWKKRAEKAELNDRIKERALRNSLFDLLSIGCMVIDLGGEKDLTEKYNLDLIGNMPYRIKQAEKEIEGERKNV